MKNELLVLGGGHGVRAYLPVELQRFSIDLDLYSRADDIHEVKAQLSKIPGFTIKGYGLQTNGGFKRFDSPPPSDVKKCTIAFTKSYSQSFRYYDVPPEFYVTVSNTIDIGEMKHKKPKSYIPIEYVKGLIPVLSPATIIASKIVALPVRKIKDFYKDVFDIYALFNKSEDPVNEEDLVQRLSNSGAKIAEAEVRGKFKQSSDRNNARNAIKLPSTSRDKYLGDWNSMNTFVRNKALEHLQSSGILIRY